MVTDKLQGYTVASCVNSLVGLPTFDAYMTRNAHALNGEVMMVSAKS